MKKVLILFFIFPTVLFAKNISVLLMGDFLISKGIETLTEVYGVDYPYRKLETMIKNADIAFANLETPICYADAATAYTNKMWYFTTSPKSADYIGNLGLDVVSIANNHIYDYGEIGLISTVEFLENKKIPYCGAGLNKEESRKSVIIQKEGYNFIFLAYNERPPKDFFASEGKSGSSELVFDEVIKDIKKHKGENNIIFVSLHWGIEHSIKVRDDQVFDAHAFIDAGADVIIGHHSHKAKPVEIYKGKPIFYSLGNAVNGYYNTSYTPNIFGQIVFSEGKIVESAIIPIEGDNFLMNFQPYPLTGSKCINFIAEMNNMSNYLNTKVTPNKKGDKGILSSIPVNFATENDEQKQKFKTVLELAQEDEDEPIAELEKGEEERAEEKEIDENSQKNIKRIKIEKSNIMQDIRD